MIHEVLVEGLVRSQDGPGEACSFHEVIEKCALMLIEALPNVSTASGENQIKQARLLTLEAK